MTKSNKSKAGRPEKITAEKLDHFKTFIIAGCTVKEACEQIEITPMTWRNYCKKHPDILPKFAKWKKELGARAKLNLTMKIINEKDINTSIYYLERQGKLKEQAARTALNRARAKQVKIQTALLEKQLEELDTTSSKISKTMDNLDIETLEKLANLDVGVDDGAN